MNIQPYGEQAIVLHLSYDTTERSVRRIRALSRALRQIQGPGIRSIRPGLEDLVIEYEPGFPIEEFLEKLTEESSAEDMATGERLIVPVCYEGEYARDIAEVEKRTGLTRAEIVALHSNATYEVWMIGFMPGYPYLGELNSKLRIPRKAKPDSFVPAGSVAIAEEFTGIYPANSPGGWHVIGRTPKKLVKYGSEPPWLFDYGMRVQFQPISAKEFDAAMEMK